MKKSILSIGKVAIFLLTLQVCITFNVKAENIDEYNFQNTKIKDQYIQGYSEVQPLAGTTPVYQTPAAENAKIYGTNRFNLDYALGYIKLSSGVAPQTVKSQIDYHNQWPGIKCYIITNTSKNSKIYIDYYNGAKYKNTYYDVREYVWVNTYEAAIGQHNGTAGSGLANTTENKLYRELHFYESGTLKTQNPKEVQWKGIMQLSDNDNLEGYQISNLNQAYLWQKTSLDYKGQNTWRGTYDGVGYQMDQFMWAEVYGSPSDPLLITYWIGKSHFSMLNFGPTEYSGTITYKPNGGSGQDIQQIIQLGYDQVINSNQFTRTDYKFLRWNTKSDGSGQSYYPGGVHTFKTNMTLYAIWQKLTYTVKFNGNGSTSGQMQNQTINRTDSTALNKNQFKRQFTVTFDGQGGTPDVNQIQSNQKFLNWKNGNIQYQDGQTVKNIAPANGSVTLYAQWEDGTITLPNSVKDGYTFIGWYDGTGDQAKLVGRANDKYKVQKNQTIVAHYIQNSDLQYIINTHLDWGANNGQGRVKIAWDNSELIKHPNAGYRTWVQNNNESYDLTDPQSWAPVQSVSSQEHTEPIYVVNFYNDLMRYLHEDQTKNNGIRVQVENKDGKGLQLNGHYTFNKYDSDGNKIGTVEKDLPMSAQLKLWMEGGTVEFNSTFVRDIDNGGPATTNVQYATVDDLGTPLKWTPLNSYTYKGKYTYNNYGKSPYDGKQLIRVIPVQLTEYYESLQPDGQSQIVVKDPDTGQYTIKIDQDAFYSSTGQEVPVDIVYFGTWDSTLEMYKNKYGGYDKDGIYMRGSNFTKQLLESGVQVVSGHDTMQMLAGDLMEYFGIFCLDYMTGTPDNWGLEDWMTQGFRPQQRYVNIIDDKNDIQNFPYKFDPNQVLDIPYQHQQSQVYLGTTVAEFQKQLNTSVNDGYLQFWGGLGTKEYTDKVEQFVRTKYNNPEANAYTYAGVYKNTALIQVGHTTGQSTDDMNKLITNILFYLKQNSKKSIFIDDRAYDKDSPTKITYGNIQKQGTTVDVNFKAAQDVGTNYYYVQQFFKPGNGSETDFINQSNKTLAQSNVAEQNVRSGVKNYYYIIDNNPGTVITQDMLNSSELIGSEIQEEHKVISGSQYNKLYNFQVEIPYKSDTFWYNNGFEMEQVNQKVVVDESELQNRNYTLEFEYDTKYLKQYVHVAAVDASGNLGDTQTTEVDRPIRVVYDQNQDQIDSVITGDVPDTVYLEYGESITVSDKNSLDAQGYRFLGWSMDKQANTDNIDSILTPGERLQAYDMVLDDNKTCTLYAIWLRVDTLTIDPNGGLWTDKYGVEVQIDGSEDYIDKDPTNITYDKPVKFGLSLNDSKKIEDAYKIGYNFYGWKIS